MNNLNIKYTGTNKVEVLTNKIPKVVIELEAYKKMCYIVKQSSKEVGWLGFIQKGDDNTITVNDVYLFKQQVGATTCEITPEGIEEMVLDLLEKENGDYIVEHLHLWGHSHVNMAVSPSAQDEKQLLSFQDNGNEWFLGVIVNKRGEFNFTYIDYINGIKVSNLSWVVNIPGFNDTTMELEIINEIKEKVSDLPTSRWWEQNNTPNVLKSKITEKESYEDIVGKFDKKDEYGFDFDPYGKDFAGNLKDPELDEEELDEDEIYEMAIDYLNDAWESEKSAITKLLKQILKDKGYNYSLKGLNKILAPFSVTEYSDAYLNSEYIKEGKAVTDLDSIKKEIKNIASEKGYIIPTENFLNNAVNFTMDLMRIGEDGLTVYDILVNEVYYSI